MGAHYRIGDRPRKEYSGPILRRELTSGSRFADIRKSRWRGNWKGRSREPRRAGVDEGSREGLRGPIPRLQSQRPRTDVSQGHRSPRSRALSSSPDSAARQVQRLWMVWAKGEQPHSQERLARISQVLATMSEMRKQHSDDALVCAIGWRENQFRRNIHAAKL